MEKYCPDAFWHLAQPLLPPHPERHQGGGRRRTDDRAMLAAIVYVLDSGCSWRKLPGSFPVHWRTARRRFAEWADRLVLNADISAANVNDHRMFEDMVDGVRPVRQPVGRPRKRLVKLHGDKGYDYPACRELLRELNIVARIARKGRRVVEAARSAPLRHRTLPGMDHPVSGAWSAATSARRPTSSDSCAWPALRSAIAAPAGLGC